MAFARQNPHLFTSTNANKASIDTELNTQTQWINATDKKIDDVAAAGIPGVTDLSNIGKIPFTDGYTIEWGKLTLDYVQPASLNETIFQDSSITQRVLGNICVGTPQLQDSCVTAEKLALNSVTPTKIPENSIPLSKLRSSKHICFIVGNADDYSYKQLASVAYQIPTRISGDRELSMQPFSVFWNFQGNNSLSGNKIALKGLVGEQLADSTITATQIADANVTTAKIANSSVTTDKIANNAIWGVKIYDGAVTANKIAGNSIITSHIQDKAVMGAKIADATITGTKLIDGSVTGAKIVDNSIDGVKLISNSVSGAKIITLDGAKILDNSINGTKLISNSVSGAKLIDGSVTGAKLLNKTITAAKIADATITAEQIANATITGTEIVNNSIPKTKLQNAGQIAPFAILSVASNATILKSLNITSVTQVDLGNNKRIFRVVFTTAATSGNAIVIATPNDTSSSPFAVSASNYTQSTTQVDVAVRLIDGSYIYGGFDMIVYDI